MNRQRALLVSIAVAALFAATPANAAPPGVPVWDLTPGRAYAEADNGNRSDIHWDLVLIQRPEHGGGRIYFDDELVRDDGKFVVEELAGLNPDGLCEVSGSPGA